MANTMNEYIIYEIVKAENIEDARKEAETNEIDASIELLDDFLESYIDVDQIIEDYNRQQVEEKRDLD